MNAINRFAAGAALLFTVGIVGAEKAQAGTATAKGSDGYNVSSLSGQKYTGATTTPAGWDNGKPGATDPNTDYIISGCDIRTPYQDANYAFQGKSLTLQNNGSAVGSITVKIFHSKTFTVNNLIVPENRTGSIINQINLADGPKKKVLSQSWG